MGIDASTRYVSFSSCGTLGNAYFGLLDALEDTWPDYDAWRHNLQGVAGCSAGSICGLILVLGLTREVRHELCDAIDVRRLIRVPDLTLLAREYGFDDGAGLREGVQQILMRGGLSSHSTLGDLKRLLRVEFVCTCTDLATSEAVHLSSTSTPDVRVCDAVQASCAVPFVFRPCAIEGALLLDGCMASALPNVFSPQETLFVNVEPGCSTYRIDGWPSFLSAIVRCCSAQQSNARDALLATCPSVRIVIPQEIMDLTSSFDICLEDDVKGRIIRSGYVATLEAIVPGFRDVLERAIYSYVGNRVHVLEYEVNEGVPGSVPARAPFEA